MRRKLTILQWQLRGVVPQMSRIIIMRLRLAVVSNPPIKPLPQRIAAASDWPKAPLAKPADYISLALENQRQLQHPRRHRRLPLLKSPGRPIVADVRVPRMPAG